MSVVIKIDGIDRSSIITWDSVNWIQGLTSQADTLDFQIKKFGTRDFIPKALSEVSMEIDGDKVFGGAIIQVQHSVIRPDGLVFSVSCKDYTGFLDRRLVVEVFENKPVINIINTIRNRYINRLERVEISDFDEAEIWKNAAVDSVHFRTGNQALKLTSTNNVDETMDRLIYLNLEPTGGFSSADYVELEAFVDSFANLERARMWFSRTSDFTADYFIGDFTTQITKDGWNLVKINKSDFATTGAPDWNFVYGIRIELTSKPATEVTMTVDNWQVLKPSAFTRDNALTATQNVQYIACNYEYPSKCFQRLAELFNWNWFVDENKDINFFAKFTQMAPFNLSDTLANHVYDSLYVNFVADQLRNAIFTRGSDYLGVEEDEDLSQQADGSNKIFHLGYKYKDPQLFQNGDEKAVGTQNLDQFHDNQGSTQLLEDGPNPTNVGDVAANSFSSQEIVVPKGGRRSKIKLRLRKVGNPVDDFRIQIFQDDGTDDKPNLVNLSSIASVSGGSLSTDYETVDFTLAETATNSLLFENDQKYHIRATRSGANDPGNYFQIDASDVATYEGYQNMGDAGLNWTRVDQTWYFAEFIDYEILHSFQEKILTFEDAPIAGDLLLFSGQPYLPVFILYKDGVSITDFGEYQFKVLDKTLKSKAGAQQRARQEIITFGKEVVEASFLTYRAGLYTGQTINIQSDIRELEQDYVIQRITGQGRGPGELQYSVSCVTTKTFTMLYWLQMQVARSDRENEIIDNETQDKIEVLLEQFGFHVEYMLEMLTGKVWGIEGLGNDLVWDGGADHIWI